MGGNVVSHDCTPVVCQELLQVEHLRDEMPGGWMAEMTRTLVIVWGQANIQSELDGVVWNRTICERIFITEHGTIVKRR